MIRSSLKAQIESLKTSPADYLPLARKIESGEFKELRPLCVAFLASFTTDTLRPFAVVEAARFSIEYKAFFGPYNHVEILALDSASALYQINPDVIVLALRLEDIAPSLCTRILGPKDVEKELSKINERFRSLLVGIRKRTTASILVWNFAETSYSPGGLGDVTLETPITNVIQRANDELIRLCHQFSGIYIFDLHRLAYEVGSERWNDPKLFFYSRVPYSLEAQRHIARRLSRYLQAIFFPPRKCLVLDLDNTLWGGVIGEDGMGGILLGEDYPGNVYKDFQRHVLGLRDRGVLLAIASKNNFTDAMEVFERHPDCLLKLEHFASIQISWQDKAISLRLIAREINLGTAALVFFDDSPTEREWIRSELPEVLVIDVPDHVLKYASSLYDSGAFDYLEITEEDRQRAEIYRQDKARNELQLSCQSGEDFLRDLQMTATCGFVDAITLPRIVQLLARTNQFNLTTRRHSAAQILRMIESGAVVIWMRLSDRFGDNGLIGVTIALQSTNSDWIIDSLLLSCRVIGRQAEKVLLAELCRIVRQRGGKTLIGEYIPTPKNMPAARTYADCDFTSQDESGYRWRWDLECGNIRCPEFFKIDFKRS